MKEIILKVVQFLKADAGFTNVIGTNLFPLVAKEGTTGEFAVYSIAAYPLSKDGKNYVATLQLFFPIGKFTQMVEFADYVGELLDTEYEVTGIEPDYSGEFKSLYTTINFNI